MKNLFAAFVCILCGVLTATTFSAVAQVYPVTNPTYIPSAIRGAVVLSAPGDYVVNTNGIGTLAFDVRGTCTSVAAVVQGSIDGTNYVTLSNIYAVAGGAAASAVAAAGDWRVNSTGYQKVRLHVTALAASCTFTSVGTPAAFPIIY